MQPLYFLIALYAIIMLLILMMTFLFRKQYSFMVGMMIAMVLGMTSGLSIGTVIGIFYVDYFYQASLVSMLVGALFGVTAGIAIHIMAVLDGLLSGVMGGMMGSMFGVMISQPYITSAIQIMGVLSVGVLFILYLLIMKEIKWKDSEKKWKLFLFDQPLIMFIFVAIFLILLSQLNYFPPDDHSNHLQMKTPIEKSTHNNHE